MRTYTLLSIFIALLTVAQSPTKTSAQTSPPPLMFTGMDGIHLLDDGMELPIWGYGLSAEGYITLPGPLLEYEVGDEVNLAFVNNSSESHTIHLHGLDVNQANDGVPSTSFIVVQDGTGAYSFTSSEAGTFLYHCHVTTTLHLTMGMYGMILVRHPDGILFEGGPTYFTDAPLLFSDLEIATNLAPVQSYPFHDIRPDYFMVNGLSGSQLETNEILSAPVGESIALRLGSMAYTRTRLIFPAELGATCWMSDGRAVEPSFAVDTLDIYPGERFTVLISPEENFDGVIEVQSWDMVDRVLANSNYVRVRDSALALPEIENNRLEMNIFPNPATDFIEVSMDLKNWKILNSAGSTLLKGNNGRRIDVSTLQSGTYWLHDENHRRATKFIVVKSL